MSKLTLAMLSLVVSFAVGCGPEDPESPPVPDGPTPSPNVGPINRKNDSLVEACIRATACGVKPYPRVSNCVNYYRDMLTPLGLAPVYDAIYRCTNAAGSCVEVRACFGVTGDCDSSFTARCEEGRAVFCDLLDRTTFAYDCAAAGATCELDGQYGFAATCVTPTPTEGALTGAVDCPEGGVCERTGRACSEDAFDRCSGERLEACLDSEWIRFDCGAAGLGPCQPQPGGWGRCSAGEI